MQAFNEFNGFIGRCPVAVIPHPNGAELRTGFKKYGGPSLPEIAPEIEDFLNNIGIRYKQGPRDSGDYRDQNLSFLHPEDVIKFLAAMDILGSKWYQEFYSKEKRGREWVGCKLEDVISKIETKDKESIIADVRKKGREYLKRNPIKEESILSSLGVAPIISETNLDAPNDKKRAKDSRTGVSDLTSTEQLAKVSSKSKQPLTPSWINSESRSLGTLVGMNKENQPNFFKTEKLQELKKEGKIKNFHITKDGCKVKTVSDTEIIFNMNERKIQSTDISQKSYDISAGIIHVHGGGFDMQALVKAAEESKDPSDINKECLYRAYAAGRKFKDFLFTNLPNDVESKLEQRFQEESKENRQELQGYRR